MKYGSTEYKRYAYERMLEERRGHNYQYPSNEQQIKNKELGYEHHIFNNRNNQESIDTLSEDLAKEVVATYRNDGYYSRIVCYPNQIIGAKYYSVIYRKK